MIFGNFFEQKEWEQLRHPVWQEALKWLKDLTLLRPSIGQHYKQDRRGDQMYAIIQVVDTKPSEECAFESHREYVDLHYCSSGSEIITYAPTDSLELLYPTKPYDEQKDCTLYQTPAQSTDILLTPGLVAIFFPEDAHMPHIKTGEDDHIKKTVIKIRRTLVP